MSNRRYFAHGTDFYRLVDEEGQHQAGPYFDKKGARYYRSYAARRRRWWNQEEYAKMIEAWKIQKLMPALDDCLGLSGHEMYLEWVDVDE